MKIEPSKKASFYEYYILVLSLTASLHFATKELDRCFFGDALWVVIIKFFKFLYCIRRLPWY
jgi:hypothetical protein